MNINPPASLLLVIVCAAAASHTQAQTSMQGTGNQQALYNASLAASCASCHGTNGKAVAGSSVMSLAGLDKDYLKAQMVAFKAGTRTATIMHQISKGYNEAQIESLASYFAAQKK
jgi:sulfide dehydrogenase cytochrome subunit